MSGSENRYAVRFDPQSSPHDPVIRVAAEAIPRLKIKRAIVFVPCSFHRGEEASDLVAKEQHPVRILI